MELAQEKVDLIEKIIKSDKKFSNNEDLYDDFFNETYKRAFLIIKTVKSESALEAYLRKIVATSIVVVLKDSGRVRREKEGYVSTHETSLETIVSKPLVHEVPDNPYSNIKISYDVVDLSDGPEEIVIKKEVLQSVLDAITIIHSKAPEKQFMELYNLRYVKNLKQKEIAKELNLSQSEISKRLLEMMTEMKNVLNKN
ncbi:sigma-70 family RNA polymerase sigma factor [bacterium]|nr:sigma-70 family RNA polymerase sigma factor [bacterium]